MRIGPRCTHRRVPGSRLVGAGDADVVVARCSLKILFFVTLLANNLGEEQTTARGCVFPKIRHCHIIITPIFTPRSSPDAEGL